MCSYILMARLKAKKKAEFTFNDRDRLVLFLKRMGELTNRTYYKQVNWQITPEKMSLTNVNEELFAAFILTFRHFYATNSPTEIGTINSIIVKAAKKINDSATIDEVKRIKKEFDKSPRFSLTPFDVNGKRFPDMHPNEEGMFGLYLNCHYFHTDPSGAQFFFQLSESHRTMAHKAFELSLYRYVRRLHAYVPLVTQYVNSPVLPAGGFSVRLLKPGEDNAEGITITIPKATL